MGGAQGKYVGVGQRDCHPRPPPAITAPPSTYFPLFSRSAALQTSTISILPLSHLLPHPLTSSTPHLLPHSPTFSPTPSPPPPPPLLPHRLLYSLTSSPTSSPPPPLPHLLPHTLPHPLTCTIPAPISPAPNTATLPYSLVGFPKRFFLHSVCPKKRLFSALE